MESWIFILLLTTVSSSEDSDRKGLPKSLCLTEIYFGKIPSLYNPTPRALDNASFAANRLEK